MADPMNALIDFRRAIAQQEIRVQPAAFYPDVFLHVDQPAGAPRYTYALVEGGEVTAVALLALTEPIEGVPTFQLGYAVIESRRSNGRAQRVAMAAIDELCRGLCRNGITKLYFEAVVDRENVASLHVADKVIGGPRTELFDHASGVPAIQFKRLVDSSQ
ncbi:N-acetyltransferase [Gluconobacter cerinus]|uniref:Acetyltransferase n=1 Tax=Gluconobacter cerinus TaxID=38307 RepID=A0AAV5N9S6_9PROT|nr:N-acetyltransferase [Gluconobacter cerinus]GBR02118.1 hypothetical protein AA0229_1611 [Gluconobacter cerinus NRIC 0229]GLQ61253.1 hypothetical protein GCM10007867_00980 [Gluconobacter cerinus]